MMQTAKKNVGRKTGDKQSETAVFHNVSCKLVGGLNHRSKPILNEVRCLL